MAYEKRDNSGSMFKNNRKEKDTHPDWTGEAIVGGQPVWINAWEKQGPQAGRFFSFSFKAKPADFSEAMRPLAGQESGTTAPVSNIDADEIPF